MVATSAVRTLFALLISTLVIAVVPAVATAAAAEQSGSPSAAPAGCGCLEEGDYEAPGGLAEPFVGGDGSSAGSNPTYRLSAGGTLPSVSLAVRRVAGNSLVTTINTNHTNWGFSPDQGRLVTWRVAGPNLEIALYDLTSNRPGTPVLTRTVSTGDGNIAFSDGGRWLSLTWLVPNTTNQAGIFIADAVSGDAVYTTTYSYHPTPGGEPLGAAGWGFSPDEGKFFHAHTTSAQQAALTLVDLDDDGDVTWTTTMTGTGHWHFSPCGTKLAVVEQTSATQMRTRLVDTVSGTVVATRTGAVTGIAFEATAAGHVAWIGGVADVLAPNPPPDCPDEQAPTWPNGAAIDAGSIGRKTLTLSWSAAVDDRAVTTYTIRRGDTVVDTVDADTRTLEVRSLRPDTSYTFSVEASDAAGHTTAGPTVTTRTLPSLPTWPAASSVYAKDVVNDRLAIRWTGATDPDGITGYVVYVDGVERESTSADTRTLTVSDLTPGTTYVIAVQAVNTDGGQSVNGPTTTVTTTQITDLDTNALRGTVYLDSNANGRRDGGEPGLEQNATDYFLRAQRVVGTREVGTAEPTINGAGEFEFSDLADGTWLISADVDSRAQSQPPVYQPHIVRIVDGVGHGGLDFGLTAARPSAPRTSSFAGTVYVDTDYDKTRDPDEPGVRDAYVSCHHLQSRVDDRCTNPLGSEEDGDYRVEGVPSGTIVTDFIGLPPRPYYRWTIHEVLTVAPGETIEGVDLGVVRGTGRVTGSVFFDSDGDGTRGAGESPLVGEDFAGCVSNAEMSMVLCDELDEAGRFEIDAVPPGTHSLSVKGPNSSWRTTTLDRTVVVEPVVGDEVAVPEELGADGPIGSVSGVVFEDDDSDGVRDPGEQARVDEQVCVVNGAQTVDCTQTTGDDPETAADESGRYRIQYVPHGSFVMEARRPGATLRHSRPAEERRVQLDDGDTVLDVGVWVMRVPPTPENVQATGRDQSVRLTWSESSGRDPVRSYEIQRLTEDETWVDQAEAEGSATSIDLQGLDNDSTYAFRMRAENAAGASGWTAPLEATTRGPAVPGAPTLEVAAGDRRATVAWTEPDDGGVVIEDYVLEQAAAGGDWVPVVTGPETTVVLSDLVNGATYRYRVAARNAVGTGAWSDPVSVTPRTTPGAPTGVAALPGDGSATLTWSPPADTGGAPVTGYVVQRASGSTWVEVGTPTDGRLAVPGLANGTAYQFRIAAVNEAGAGAWTSPVTVTPKAPKTETPPATAPAAPRGLRAAALRRAVRLAWRPPASTGGAPIQDYVVQRAVRKPRGWTEVADRRTASTGLKVRALKPGKVYFFRVAAVSSAGRGSWSKVVRVTVRR